MERVLELLRTKYGWDYYDTLTGHGKKLVADTISVLDELESQALPELSKTYTRNHFLLTGRIIAIWRILTRRNFILVDYSEFEKDGQKGKKIRPLYRTDYSSESEFLALKGAMLMKIRGKV